MEKPNPVAQTLIAGIIYFLLMMLGALIELPISLEGAVLAIIALPFVCLLTFIISCFFQKEWSRENKYAVIIFFILFSIVPGLITLTLLFP